MFAAFLVIFVFAPLVLLFGSLVFHCPRSFVLRVRIFLHIVYLAFIVCFFSRQFFVSCAIWPPYKTFQNCCLPLHRITVRSSDYKVRMWLPDKLTNATQWQFAVHISHYSAYKIFNLKLWFENNLTRLRMDFLSIGFCKQTNKQRMTTFVT